MSELLPGCGLIIVSSKKPVPLKGISVDIQVKGFVADVSATLKYKNLEEKAIESVFVFPMNQDSAVYSFEATVEGKKIVADLQEKKQNMDPAVWATLLAVIWLHASCQEQRDEWELLEGKAISWIKSRAGSSLSEFIRAGNELLKSSVDPKVFGL